MLHTYQHSTAFAARQAPRWLHMEGCSIGMLLTNPMVMQALYQKQGRSAQFASVAERDRWLREEARKLQEAQNKTGATRRAVQDAIASLNSELMELSQVCLLYHAQHATNRSIADRACSSIPAISNSCDKIDLSRCRRACH